MMNINTNDIPTSTPPEEKDKLVAAMKQIFPAKETIMTDTRKAAEKVVAAFDANTSATLHAAIESLRSALAKPDDKDLLTIAYMDGHHAGKRDALAQHGEQWGIERLEALRVQAQQPSLAAKEAYINGLEFELQKALAQQGRQDDEIARLKAENAGLIKAVKEISDGFKAALAQQGEPEGQRRERLMEAEVFGWAKEAAPAAQPNTIKE